MFLMELFPLQTREYEKKKIVHFCPTNLLFQRTESYPRIVQSTRMFQRLQQQPIDAREYEPTYAAE
jgi:hypothetical protein